MHVDAKVDWRHIHKNGYDGEMTPFLRDAQNLIAASPKMLKSVTSGRGYKSRVTMSENGTGLDLVPPNS
jgi:hypothetical protein